MARKAAGVRPIKTKFTKAALVNHLIEAIETEHDLNHISSADVKKIVRGTLDHLGDTMKRSIMPRGLGEFMLPQLLKVKLRERKAIKKGTKVRNPATGEMIPSKGRPRSFAVKVSPLTGLKKAALGEL